MSAIDSVATADSGYKGTQQSERKRNNPVGKPGATTADE